VRSRPRDFHGVPMKRSTILSTALLFASACGRGAYVRIASEPTVPAHAADSVPCQATGLPSRGWHRVSSQDRRLSVMLPKGGSIWDAKKGSPDSAGHVSGGAWATDRSAVYAYFGWVPEVGRHEGVCTFDTQAGRMEVMMWYGHYATIVAWHFYAWLRFADGSGIAFGGYGGRPDWLLMVLRSLQVVPSNHVPHFRGKP
jgi:hypothetical protein